MMSSTVKELLNKLLLLFIPLLLITCWFFHEMSSESTGGGGAYDLTTLFFAFCLAGYALFYLLLMFIWLLVLVYQRKSTHIHTKCMLFGLLVAVGNSVYVAMLLL